MRSQLRHGFLKDALDWKRFGELLFERFSDRDMSFRAVAFQVGLPDHMALYRACAGEPVSADTYLFFCREFNIDPFAVFTMPARPLVEADAE